MKEKRSRAPIPAGRWSLLAVTAVGALLVAMGAMLGVGALLLGLAGVALVLAVALFWSSLLGISADQALSVDEALALVMPSSEEERKTAVLRALKDLEYERAVGKISEEDYATLVARYRAEAKRLLYLVDQEDSQRLAAAERQWSERLAAERLTLDTTEDGGGRKPPEAEAAEARPARGEAPRPQPAKKRPVGAKRARAKPAPGEAEEGS